jgi:hypothetical protein
VALPDAPLRRRSIEAAAMADAASLAVCIADVLASDDADVGPRARGAWTGQVVRRHPCGRRRQHRRRRPDAACADRPQWRRQDHAVQSRIGFVSAGPRPRDARRCGDQRRIAEPRCRRGIGASFQITNLFRAVGRGEPAARRAGATRAVSMDGLRRPQSRR